MDLEKVTGQVVRGKAIEDVLGKSDWKNFEAVVGDIFRQNDFRVWNNFRFKTGRRYEIDLVASRSGTVFCVDCKRWSRGRDKTWRLAKAANDQEKRTTALRKFLRSNPIAQGIMKFSECSFVSVVTTLYEENILKEGKTFVVPAKKLNAFILNFDAMSD